VPSISSSCVPEGDPSLPRFATCGNKQVGVLDHLRQYHNRRLQSIAPLRSLSLSWAGKKMGRDVNAKSAVTFTKKTTRPDSQNARCSLRRTAPNRAHMAYDHAPRKAFQPWVSMPVRVGRSRKRKPARSAVRRVAPTIPVITRPATRSRTSTARSWKRTLARSCGCSKP
jgi:hypothetical protein